MATLYRNFLAGVVDNNPLASGGTSLSSSGLASLPVVTAPDIMWLVLDPDADDGAPELVKVTAHTSSATTATIDRAEQSTSARAHNQNTTWRIVATQTDLEEFLKTVTTADIEDDAVTGAKIAAGEIDLAHLAAEVANQLVPAGTIRTTINTSADTGWLLFNQTVVGAESTYPALWAVAPAGWKSGSDLALPNLDDTVLMDAGSVATLGTVSGANTQAIAQANLPAHVHTVNPPSTNVTGGSVVTDVSLSAPGEHAGTGSVQHVLSVSTTTGAVDVAQFDSGSVGSGTALNIAQKNLGVVFQIKAH